MSFSLQNLYVKSHARCVTFGVKNASLWQRASVVDEPTSLSGCIRCPNLETWECNVRRCSSIASKTSLRIGNAPAGQNVKPFLRSNRLTVPRCFENIIGKQEQASMDPVYRVGMFGITMHSRSVSNVGWPTTSMAPRLIRLSDGPSTTSRSEPRATWHEPGFINYI